MELLLQICEKLNYVYTLTNCVHLELPSIVLIGDQNVGKSSLIENIIGHTFLPKGPDSSGTRCPLEIKTVRKENDSVSDCAVFLSAPDCLITDFETIRQQIQLQADRKIGPNNDITSDSISLRIFTNKVPSINVVDLPGLRKVSKDGYKHANDFEKMINNIIMKYISVNSIILVVIPANLADLGNIEALNLAKQVDPTGGRTLMVITKIDLVDAKSVEIHELLSGKLIKTNLGTIGVYNNIKRDKKMIRSDVEFFRDETSFLKTKYSRISHQHGVIQLKNSLYQLLLHNVRDYLINVKDEITGTLRKQRQILMSYGMPIADLNRAMLEIVSNFSLAYTSTILGPYKELEITELTGGARINYIFREIFGQAIQEIHPLDGFNQTTLLTAIRNSTGVKSTIFVPDNCFDLLVKKQIKKLEAPAFRCVQLVFEEMERLIDRCDKKILTQLSRFPKLKKQIKSIVVELLKSRENVTNEMVQHLINIQTAYINTGHPDFIAQTQEWNRDRQYELCRSKYECYGREVVTAQCRQDNISNDPLSTECLIVETLLIRYFNIVKTSIEDSVPKTIMHFLVNYLVENLQSELVAKLFDTGIPDLQLMEESGEIIEERRQIFEIMRSNENAIDIITELKEALK